MVSLAELGDLGHEAHLPAPELGPAGGAFRHGDHLVPPPQQPPEVHGLGDAEGLQEPPVELGLVPIEQLQVQSVVPNRPGELDLGVAEGLGLASDVLGHGERLEPLLQHTPGGLELEDVEGLQDLPVDPGYATERGIPLALEHGLKDVEEL